MYNTQQAQIHYRNNIKSNPAKVESMREYARNYYHRKMKEDPDFIKKRKEKYMHLSPTEKAEYIKKQSASRREKYLQLYRSRLREGLYEYLSWIVCENCGQSYPPKVYDFHHIDPSSKHECVSRLLGGSLEKLMIEVDKCSVLCANCHRMLHG